MATAGIQITAEIAELRQLQQDIGKLFSKEDKAKILEDALKKAIEPAYQRLVQVTPVGPTGNLKRAVSKKIRTYTKDGGAVALIGFRRAATADSASAQGGTVRIGPDRARHQYWLEEGTGERYVKGPTPAKPYKRPGFSRRAFQRQGYTMTRKGKTFPVRAHTIGGHSVSGHDVVNVTGAFYYASSFKRLGPFKIVRNADGEVQTDPAYPNAFFKKSRDPIRIPPMPAGGSSGNPPLTTAWADTQPLVAEILMRELRLTLEQALSTLSSRIPGTPET